MPGVRPPTRPGYARRMDGATLPPDLETFGRRIAPAVTDSIPTLHTALAKGGPVDIAVSGVAADSLGARRLGDIAYEVATNTGVQSVLVSDDDLIRARRALWEGWRIVAEHGAAAPLAALAAQAYRPEPGERVALIICGANTDPSDL